MGNLKKEEEPGWFLEPAPQITGTDGSHKKVRTVQHWFEHNSIAFQTLLHIVILFKGSLTPYLTMYLICLQRNSCF
jgi:hypothetical protein